MLTAERLRELFNYDPATGALTWRIRRQGARRAEAGSLAASDGYRRVTIDGRVYYAHRLAWLHVYGEWPSLDIDHVNRDRSDNRIANLREASRSLNSHNRGGRGCCFTGKRWQAQINVNYKAIHLGMFDTEQEATAAYRSASLKYYGNELT